VTCKYSYTLLGWKDVQKCCWAVIDFIISNDINCPLAKGNGKSESKRQREEERERERERSVLHTQ